MQYSSKKLIIIRINYLLIIRIENKVHLLIITLYFKMTATRMNCKTNMRKWNRIIALNKSLKVNNRLMIQECKRTLFNSSSKIMEINSQKEIVDTIKRKCSNMKNRTRKNNMKMILLNNKMMMKSNWVINNLKSNLLDRLLVKIKYPKTKLIKIHILTQMRTLNNWFLILIHV